MKHRNKLMEFIFGVGGAAVIVLLIALFFPYKVQIVDSVDRLVYALKWHLLTAVFLMFIIQQIGAMRFHYKELANPLEGEVSEDLKSLMKIRLQILSNTMEQSFLFVLLSLCMALVIPAKHTIYIPAVIILFFIGRVSFYIGYHYHPNARGIGISHSMMANLLCLMLAVKGLYNSINF